MMIGFFEGIDSERGLAWRFGPWRTVFLVWWMNLYYQPCIYVDHYCSVSLASQPQNQVNELTI
jgi:hypothetical protein